MERHMENQIKSRDYKNFKYNFAMRMSSAQKKRISQKWKPKDYEPTTYSERKFKEFHFRPYGNYLPNHSINRRLFDDIITKKERNEPLIIENEPKINITITATSLKKDFPSAILKTGKSTFSLKTKEKLDENGLLCTESLDWDMD